jgi:hypothetical protein
MLEFEVRIELGLQTDPFGYPSDFQMSLKMSLPFFTDWTNVRCRRLVQHSWGRIDRAEISNRRLKLTFVAF